MIMVSQFSDNDIKTVEYTQVLVLSSDGGS
jgi:hypothetical protein